MIPGCLSYQHESITDTSKNIIPERVNPYCVAWSRFSFEYENSHPDQRPLVSVWNQSPGRLERVAHALFSPSKLRWRRVSHFGRWMQRKTNFLMYSIQSHKASHWYGNHTGPSKHAVRNQDSSLY